MLAGDVMTGRGIDPVLPYPSPAVLYEDCVESALNYVRLGGERERPHSEGGTALWDDTIGGP